MQQAVQTSSWQDGWQALSVRARKSFLVLLGLVAALLAALITSAMSGAVKIPWSVLPAVLAGSGDSAEPLLRQVLLEIRLPRVLFSAVVGAALAVTGVAMQALFRNPLGETGRSWRAWRRGRCSGWAGCASSGRRSMPCYWASVGRPTWGTPSNLCAGV